MTLMGIHPGGKRVVKIARANDHPNRAVFRSSFSVEFS